MTNVGIDFMALRNRLTLTADWYVKNTKDILLNVLFLFLREVLMIRFVMQVRSVIKD